MQARNVELSSLVSRRGSVGGDVSPWGKVSSPLGQSGEPPTARLSGSTALTRSTGQGAVTAAAAAAAAAGAKQSASAALLQLVDNPTDQVGLGSSPGIKLSQQPCWQIPHLRKQTYRLQFCLLSCRQGGLAGTHGRGCALWTAQGPVVMLAFPTLSL